MSTAAMEVSKSNSSASLADVARKSELKELGWTIRQNGKEWTGFEKTGDLRKVGPASSLKALHTQVMLTAKPQSGGNGKGDKPRANGVTDSDAGFELTNEDNASAKRVKVKQPLLPNTEKAVLQDLRTAILDYRATTMDILAMQETQKSQKAMAMALMHKFEDQLTVDEKTGVKSFQAEMIIAELVVEEKEVLKTRTA